MSKPLASSKRILLGDPYVTAGPFLYAIGAQDGLFPPIGTPSHIPNEMGGVWAGEYKLLDGFWAEADCDGARCGPLSASCHTTLPEQTVFMGALPALDLTFERAQFVPDDLCALVIAYTLTNTGAQDRDLSFTFLARTKLMPTWLGDRIGVEDGADALEWRCECGAWLGTDAKNGWSVAFGGDRAPVAAADNVPVPVTHGSGAGASLSYRLTVPAHGSQGIRFFIAGGKDGAQALDAFTRAREAHAELLARKTARMATLQRAGRMSVQDERIGDALRWVRVNYDWLLRDVPGIGRGLGAGLPEYPWWFGCDNGYALLGMLAYGRFEDVASTLRLLRDVSRKASGNGRIVHEVSMNGVVYNLGNTQETAHFIKTVWTAFTWSGDEAFLRDMLPDVKRGVDWLIARSGADLLPVGYGIIEIEGLNLKNIDTAVLTQRALDAYAHMQQHLGEDGADEWTRKAEALKARIHEAFWREQDGEYGDFRAQGTQVATRREKFIGEGRKERSEAFIALVDRVIGEARAAGEHEAVFNMRNWIACLPMQEGIAPEDAARRALDRMAGEDFVGRFGLYLAGAGPRTHAMTISTGAAAEANGQYGNIERMLGYVAQIASMFHLRTPGAASEMCPDYGCFVQAWTGYGLLWVLARYLYGVQPYAAERCVVFTPRLPLDWGQWAYENVRIGDAEFSFYARRDGARVVYSVIGPRGWQVTFRAGTGMESSVRIHEDALEFVGAG